MTKPTLFNTDMVRAILEGRKTVTRRVVQPQPEITPIPTFGGSYRVSMKENIFVKPPYRPGDILYVRETWRPISAWSGSYTGCRIEYKAGGVQIFDEIIALPTQNGEWHPSIHMPREAARIFLRVTDVRVERLQAVMDDPPGPENQIVKEGCKYGCDFIATWDSTIKPADRAIYGWEANPYVWRIEFNRCEKPEENT